MFWWQCFCMYKCLSICCYRKETCLLFNSCKIVYLYLYNSESVIVSLISIFASLQSHKLVSKFFKFNLTIVRVIRCTWGIIYFNPIFILNLDCWFSYYFLIFRCYILHIDLRSSIIYCLSFGDVYIALGISLSSSFVTVSKLFCCETFEIPVILLANLLPIKCLLPTSCFRCFLNYYFWSSFTNICSRFLSMIKKFSTVFTA